MKLSGIYKIVNRVNGKYYVGSSKDIKFRWAEHVSDLRGNKHDNDYLQKSWNKYGEDAFEFLIVEHTGIEQLLIVEQKYLDISKTEGDKSYNLKFEAMGGGLTEYSRAKIVAANKRRVRTKHSLETRMKISKSMMGKTMSTETKQKCGLASKKHWQTIKRTVDNSTNNVILGP
jgi:group I intron endonuclease